jgi:hypothetical protein
VMHRMSGPEPTNRVTKLNVRAISLFIVTGG